MLNNTITRRPTAGTVAVVAATAVVLTTTTFSTPEPAVAALTPRISTATVQLAALPLTPDTVRIEGATARHVADSVPDVFGPVRVFGRTVATGISAGMLAGFFIGGALGANLISRIPAIGQALTPIAQLMAIGGAVIGAPVGALVGTYYAVKNLVSPPVPPPAAARSVSPTGARKKPAASHRSTKPGSRSNRHVATSSAKTTATQQVASTSRAGTGRGHAGTARR